MPETIRVDYSAKEYDQLVMERHDKGRDSWRIQVHAGSLKDVCTARSGYHAGRKTWWMSELEDVEAKVRESGLELREQQVTGGQRFEAVIDNALSGRLAECKQKVNGHRDQERTYAEWADFLGGMPPEHSLELSMQDALFFQPKPREAE